ncbi:putative cationic amino acid transporter like protein [Argiope bruennichi]|uniref:Putative cationic amino acid transporter like protein n=1 Tax=Argiope bruennichi TaxID=94029 RepID=A0A8T0EBN2_ARGBR|nr:putative cationic amino acid transporter like protein [Argiope bruennichi]
MFVIGSQSFRQKMLVILGKLIRTKDLELADPHEAKAKTQLKKVLTTVDLTSLGVGSCVGTGMYLVAGMVAHKVTGPSVVMSFIIAAVASLFSGVCYAEFGVRVPHTTGSAYMYSYVTVGEFIAFVIGWNMVLEYLIGTAAGACAISACVDAISGGAISTAIRNGVGTLVGHTPDFLAVLITFFMTLLMVAGVKKSLLFTNIMNAVNFSVWIFIMTAGLFYVDTSNWSDHGGFLPFGWSGVLSGAATCFYAFIGFDIIATTGEEAKNPKWSIPMAVIISLVIVLTAYITSSMMLTLIVPYDQIDFSSALVEMFAQRGAYKCKYIVAVGALAGLTVSMFGSMFPMPRIVYAMAKDGLIFRSLGAVWPFTGTPAKATCLLGIATAVVSLVMSLDVLVEMMSIGTLMAYTLVSTCVLLLRYQPPRTTLVQLLPESIRSACPTPSKENPAPDESPRGELGFENQRPDLIRDTNHRDDDLLMRGADTSYGAVPPPQPSQPPPLASAFTIPQRIMGRLMRILPYHWINPGEASGATGIFVMKMVGVLYLLVIIMDLIVVCAMPALENRSGAAIFFLLVFLFGIIFCLIVISRQPQTKCDLKFKAPCVPFIPGIAITVNIYLIFKLSVLTLVRFLLWMSVGLFMYFWYGIKNSSLEMETDKPLELKIPQDRADNLCPPDNQYMMAGAGTGEVVEEVGYAETYAAPTHNGYVAQPDPLAADPWSQPDPLAENPWSKYN